MNKKNAVMALSGGMDSSSLLLHLLHLGYNVTCLSFDYGQKHHVELERAKSLVEYLSQHGYEVEHKFVDLKSAFSLFESDLLVNGGDVPEGHYEEDSMKATVVPNRNAIFASLLYGTALSLSEKTGSSCVVALGVHSGDHAIYPDCRPEFYESLHAAFKLGNWDHELVAFDLPFLHGDKETILLNALESTKKLGWDFDTVLGNTITSYNPDINGNSSGTSGSDIERILAFHAIGRKDPIPYVLPWENILSNALAVEKKHKGDTHE